MMNAFFGGTSQASVMSVCVISSVRGVSCDYIH